MAMSTKASFMQAALRHARGATRSRDDKQHTFAQLERYAKEHTWRSLTPETLTLKQFKAFIQAQGGTPRSLQNIASHIRAALKGAGRETTAKAPEWSNAALMIASRPGDRTGKHEALTWEKITAALDKGRPEFCALASLQASLGLRMEEALSVTRADLQAWSRLFGEGRPMLPVRAGTTKGGRPRVISIAPSMESAARSAIAQAENVFKDGRAFLVPSPNPAAARRQYGRLCAEAGLSGKQASHALRYRFAHDRMRAYLDEGRPEHEALRLLSNDLGHGDGRGRYVKSVYLRGFYEEEG